jgi:hypothetical protein
MVHVNDDGVAGAESESGEALMPAEMYVPNQKQWLSLRAAAAAPLARALCCAALS